MSVESILNYLTMVSNSNIWLNLVMHIIVLIATISVYLIHNEKVKRVIFHGSILLLFLSVALNAMVFRNPFILVCFGILALVALVQLFRGEKKIPIPGDRMNTIVALAFILLGLWYPKFVDANILESLIVSPVGIVPCPTFLVTLGLLNLAYPNVNKFHYGVTAVMGLIFGIIGVFKFKVYFDITLLVIVAYSLFNLMKLRVKKGQMVSSAAHNKDHGPIPIN